MKIHVPPILMKNASIWKKVDTAFIWPAKVPVIEVTSSHIQLSKTHDMPCWGPWGWELSNDVLTRTSDSHTYHQCPKQELKPRKSACINKFVLLIRPYISVFFLKSLFPSYPIAKYAKSMPFILCLKCNEHLRELKDLFVTINLKIESDQKIIAGTDQTEP